MTKLMIALASVALTFVALPALADTPPTCASGEKIVSFLDGDQVTYSCVEDSATMDATVEDLSQEGQVDPGNYD